ncbi:protein phosphatase 2C like protein 2/3 [Trypanosoma rangeli]|uniref:Protein phosphatase 2C like protein 2/3 n=1 Tax=Trypanosoma rangeli TaxID=5698 RepID=A0A422P293_TRYRA|nr:protein phosphatase 2C like protein 2/3 [Trypanosoma rangeli]RNF11837.1 protein phosphatase 2C like protein 2/3 [Trypanosoma rangeli]|eukprot:RNF11837.1 protein phosphatase 2C like protein 2/3 [Trypanosoma rangeli]
MGETLSKPVTEKHTSTFETSHLRVGCCGMQGWRKTMEDAHVAQLNLEGNKHHAFFGVFDGHNGYKIAKYCSGHILDELMATPEYREGIYDEAFKKAFLSLDQKLSEMPTLRSEGGTAIICVLLAQGEIVCANAGDSRAVLFRGDTVIPLSRDHKPTVATEKARIEKAGGTVQCQRINGTIALSRAIGDFDFKENSKMSWEEQMVTALPEVNKCRSSSEDAFIVIACDGVWDVLSNEECCDLVKRGLKETDGDIGLVCEMVLDKCIAPRVQGVGCDNMTIIVAQFKPAFFFQV